MYALGGQSGHVVPVEKQGRPICRQNIRELLQQGRSRWWRGRASHAINGGRELLGLITRVLKIARQAEQQARILVLAPVPGQSAKVKVAALDPREKGCSVQAGGIEKDAGATKIHGKGADLCRQGFRGSRHEKGQADGRSTNLTHAVAVGVPKSSLIQQPPS